MLRRACEGRGTRRPLVPRLRRSFVTGARKAGVPESVVMKMSGHKTRAVFDRYNVVNEEDLRAAVTRSPPRTLLGHSGGSETQKVERAPAKVTNRDLRFFSCGGRI